MDKNEIKRKARNARASVRTPKGYHLHESIFKVTPCFKPFKCRSRNHYETFQAAQERRSLLLSRALLDAEYYLPVVGSKRVLTQRTEAWELTVAREATEEEKVEAKRHLLAFGQAMGYFYDEADVGTTITDEWVTYSIPGLSRREGNDFHPELFKDITWVV